MPRAKHRKNIFVVPFHFFGSTNTISRFGERFRDGQYSLFSFLFAVLLLTFSASEMTYIVSSGALNSTHSLTSAHVPPCPAICKSGRGGARAPRALCSRRLRALLIK